MQQFEQRLLAEGLRAIEGDSPALPASVSLTSSANFEQRLLQRAVALEPQLHILPIFSHFQRSTKNLFRFFSLFFIVLGAMSVQQLFFTEQGTQINFFWAFALFFIPNLLALCLWLLIFFRGIFTAGWLGRCSLSLLKTVEKRFNSQAIQEPHFWSLFKCYFTIAFTGDLGRYQLSALTHRLWLSYFFGATLMLVIMLATHQVDFIWQTSILSLQSYQWLTELLAYIPSLLGISVPDAILIQQSHLGVVNVIADAQHSRYVWSSLLISSLLIYGLVPRFLLWLLMGFLLKRAKKQFNLNLSSPYYVQLRQLLKPNVTSLGVSDPDRLKAMPLNHLYAGEVGQSLPGSFYPVAIELSEAQLLICNKHVAQYSTINIDSLKHICDFQDQQSLIASLDNIKQPAIFLYVALAHLPDRGLLGFVKSLTAAGNQAFYLLLIDDAQRRSELLQQRRNDWYALADQAAIPLDNIIHVNMNTP